MPVSPNATPLRLVPTAARTKAAAWFVPGPDAHTSIGHLLQTPEAGGLRFLIIAHTDNTIAGVLVEGLTGPPPHLLAEPYQIIEGCLLIPVTAALQPHVSAEEVREQFGSRQLSRYVWHPSAGLIGFEDTDLLSADMVLAAPRSRPRDWGLATPGVRISSRLVSIDPDVYPTTDDVLERGRDDIGTETDLNKMPRSPDETTTAGLRDTLTAMQRPLARAAKWFADRTPSTADSRTWVNSLQDWASGVLAAGAANRSRRMNEMRRLMNMLQNDPDQGLRYALPFGGGGSRGLAPPSDRLAERNVDYQFGGPPGAADYWEVPWEMQQHLRNKYRELALREQSLGRYRRAAYIYADLLGDFGAAAAVLEQGQHFTEAATLYADKLGQPRKAAECLERGGLWSAAISIYEQIDDWQQVARIHQKLGNEEPARSAWHKAAEACERESNFLQAADIYETRLGDLPTALNCLQRGWDRSHRSRDCLQELFEVLGRHTHHDSARDRIHRLAEQTDEAVARQGMIAQTLADISHSYPDSLIRVEASQATQRIVSRNLLSDTGPGTFLGALRALAPEDRLLTRDCSRYADDRNAKPRKPAARRTIQCEERVHLDPDTTWTTAATDGRYVYVAGFQSHALVVARWDMNEPRDQPDYVEWYLAPAPSKRIEMVVQPTHERPLKLHLHTSTNIRKDFAYKASKLGQLVGNAPQSDLSILALGTAPSGQLWAAELDEGRDCFVRAYQPDNRPAGAAYQIVSGTAAALAEDAFVTDSFGVTATRSYVCVTLPDELIVVDLNRHAMGGSEPQQYCEAFRLPQRSTGLSRSRNAASATVAVTFEEGGLLHSLPTGSQRSFGHGLVNPVAAFSPQGSLIAADEHGVVEVYTTHNESLNLVTTAEPYQRKAVAVLTSHSNRFCIVYSDGVIDMHRFRR